MTTMIEYRGDMSLKQLLRLQLERAGISVRRHPVVGTHQWLLKELFSRTATNCVFDVGGHIGSFARQLRAWGYKGPIVSFEPVPSSYARLEASMRSDPLWIGQPYGLSNESRVAFIKTYSKSDFNSLLNLRDDAERAYQIDGSGRSEVRVELRRLDEAMADLAPRLPNAPCIYMKMDTQGHDMQVMQGAAGILHRLCGFQSELPAVQIYHGMASMPDLLAYYSQIGFVPIGFFPVNTFDETMISPEFDVVFTRIQEDYRALS